MPKVYTSRDINAVLRRQLEINRAVRVGGVKGHHSICVAITDEAKITVEGVAGDFFGALNNKATIKLVGKADRYAGSTMTGGELIIEGDAGEGAGVCMQGGTLLVEGSAEDGAGAGMAGGVLIINGNAGDRAGYRMRGGKLIITGSAGKDVGLGMRGGEIFIASEIGSVGRGASIDEALYDEKKEIATILEKYGIKAKLALFEKITPQEPEEDGSIRISVEGEE
ncbi:MAG: tributyrin esterase [Candidatus Thermoplasmatota archaeon]|nr:tributyrin esterase [Candidatus Thermoplasmatota archaeon]